MSLQGVQESEIAETLKADKIPTPIEYRKIGRGEKIKLTYA
jgi:hypothetical protein